MLEFVNVTFLTQCPIHFTANRPPLSAPFGQPQRAPVPGNFSIFPSTSFCYYCFHFGPFFLIRPCFSKVSHQALHLHLVNKSQTSSFLPTTFFSFKTCRKMFNTLSWSIFSSSIQVSAKSVWSLPNATLPSSNTKTKRLLPPQKLRLAATKSRKADLSRLHLPESNALVCVFYTPMQALSCSTVYIPPFLRTLHHVQSVRYWNKIIKFGYHFVFIGITSLRQAFIFLNFFFTCRASNFSLSFWGLESSRKRIGTEIKVENVIYQNVQKKVEQTKKGFVIRRKKGDRLVWLIWALVIPRY